MDQDDLGLLNVSESSNSKLNDDNVYHLKCMGFLDESEIRYALQIAKNDLNEALTILTSEKTSIPIELDDSKANEIDMDQNDKFFDCRKFPLDCLDSLELNLRSENWDLILSQNEKVERLLKSSIYLTEENQFNDINYDRFISRLYPSYFKKVLESASVNKWNERIQKNVYSSILLSIDLIASKLNSKNTDNLDIFLDILALILNPSIEFNKKNLFRLRQISASDYQNEQKSGWIVDYVNKFANSKGFDNLTKLLETSDLNKSNLILKPISFCIDYLNKYVLKQKLEEPIKILIKCLSNMESMDQFNKKVN